MTVAAVILLAVLITAAAMWFASRGASRHQEDLNTHGDGTDVIEPRGGRPADAAAESMDVDSLGQPGIRPPQ